MKVIKMLVDELPEGCDSCPMNFNNGSNSYCVPLIETQNDKKSLDYACLTYGMYNFRRHDCPLSKDIKNE